jgi:hypothetical protein
MAKRSRATIKWMMVVALRRRAIDTLPSPKDSNNRKDSAPDPA